MKKSKKLLALLILVTTVLTLSACGKKPAEEGNIDFEGKTLTIGVWGGK